MGGRSAHQEADQVFGVALHRLLDELGAAANRQRVALSIGNRCAVSKEFPRHRQEHSQTHVSRYIQTNNNQTKHYKTNR